MTGYQSKKTEAQDKLAQPAPVQEPVAWPCVIAEANFEQNTITLEMQCSDYKVRAGQHWLYTTLPAAQPAQEPVEDVVEYRGDGTRIVRIAPQRPWVDLTDEDWEHIHDMRGTSLDNFSQGAVWAEAKLKERNA